MEDSMRWTARLLALAFASTLGACCIEPEAVMAPACSSYSCYTPVGGYCDYGYARGYEGYGRGNYYRRDPYGRPNFYGRSNVYGRPVPYGRPTPHGRPS